MIDDRGSKCIYICTKRFGNVKDKSANAFAINQQMNLHDTYLNVLSLGFPIAS